MGMRLQQENIQLEHNIQQVNEEKSGLQRRLDAMQRDKIISNDRIREQKSLYEKASKENIKLEKELSASREEIEVLFEEIDKLEKKSDSKGKSTVGNNENGEMKELEIKKSLKEMDEKIDENNDMKDLSS